MRMLAAMLLMGLLPAVAGAQQLNWTELANRSELWPAQCTVATTIRFEGGVTVPAGTKVVVVGFKGNEVDLRTADGRTDFAAEPDETDVLAVARAQYAGLSPTQRALTYPALAQRKELWPYRVTITRGFDVAPGKPVRAGDQVLVKAVEAGRVDVVSEKLNARFGVAVAATDLMAQARKFVDDEQAGPRLLAVQRLAEAKWAEEQKAHGEKIKAMGRVTLELEGKLVNAVTGRPEPLDPGALPRYFVFLRGSTTCSITRNFAPGFIRFCKANQAQHPEFEVVYLTIDSLPDTAKFAQELGFSWRAVTYEDTTMPSVNPLIDGRIPQLIVMDRNGKVLANGIQSTAPDALRQLDALMKQPNPPN